jgi:ANTAR domain
VTDPDAAVIVPSPSAGLSKGDLGDRLGAMRSQAAAAQERARELQQRMQAVQAEVATLMQAMASARETCRKQGSHAARWEPLARPAYARMAARLQTMPVIEQAKGVIMAQSRCGEAEAFEILRRASQQSNVPVRELAAQIVAKAAG